MAKQQPSSNAAHDSGGENRPGLVTRLRAAAFGWLPRWSKRTKIAIGVVALLIVVHMVGLVIWLPKYLNSEIQRLTTLPMALQALDRHALMEAKAVAKILQQPGGADSQDRGGPGFVVGAATAEEAAVAPEADRAGVYRSAAEYLEQARVLGFPEGRRSQGLFLLGKSLCLSGQYPAAQTVLDEAINADSHAYPEAFNLLAIAYSQGADADWNKARQYSEQYLAESTLTPEERDQALLLNAQILDHLGDRSGCQAALAQIPDASSAAAGAQLLQAELTLRAARALSANANADANTDDQPRAEAAAQYQQAAQQLMQVLTRSGVSAGVMLRVAYFLGVCELEQGDKALALDQFRRVREQSPASEEGIAAAFQSADLLRRQGSSEEALSLLRHVVQAFGGSTKYHNDLLSIEDLRKSLLSGYEADLQTSQFDEAAQISRLLQPLFPPQRELELTGELLQVTGKAYLSKAAIAPPDEAKALAAKGRSNLRRAGQAFSKLAELHTTSRTYADDLWSAADCYLQGHDYTHAAESLELYLKNELRRRRATALLLLGEARLALGQTDQALSTLQECIDTYASDPASYQARLLAAQGNQEKGEGGKAEELLQANLEGGNLTPRSSEWRDSLFALGKLLQAGGRYDEAIPRLEEAVQRYPDAGQAIEARYLIADSYRHLGQQTQQKMAAQTIEKLRVADAQKMQQQCGVALEQYHQVTALISDQKHEHGLEPLERAILRNCYFAMGATLYDLGRYEDAIQAYADAANFCRNEPESLEAFVQMASCYRKLNRPQQARGSIVQATATLQRIDKNANFALTTNFTREQWRQLLNQMAEL